MNTIVKLLIGAILMAAAVWWVIQGSMNLIKRDGLTDLITILNAGIPLGIFFIGLFIVWLELDEIKIEREIKSEEKKDRKKK
jgi:uncharacterized membrane protein YciS (DUF1049 family)